MFMSILACIKFVFVSCLFHDRAEHGGLLGAEV
ncbi:hypothetical protein M6B38_167035 [Iris pallida]|uniref:Uncharacterized protein n=1 Tax=Iris pallida TaxID=29817 RepID=A0AAX6EW66_IRIPA|nr:hypothetical protein M6B38_167035 [Iris pallida]